MFRNGATNPREHVIKVEIEERPKRLPARLRHLENRETRARLEHPRGFPESGLEIHQVPNAPPHNGAIEVLIRERKFERIRRDRQDRLLLDLRRGR